MEKKKIIIVGGGTYAVNVISYVENLSDYKIVGIIDFKKTGSFCGYDILGSDEILPKLYYDEGIRYAIIGIAGTARFDMSIRKKIFLNLKKIGFKLPNLIDKTVSIHKSVKLKEGIIIPQNVVIDPEVEIGNNVFLSPFVYISHHVKLRDHIFISSFVNFRGGVTIGEQTLIGMSATIANDVGKNCNIYPKTLVMDKVEDNNIVYGNPPKKISKKFFK